MGPEGPTSALVPARDSVGAQGNGWPAVCPASTSSGWPIPVPTGIKQLDHHPQAQAPPLLGSDWDRPLEGRKGCPEERLRSLQEMGSQRPSSLPIQATLLTRARGSFHWTLAVQQLKGTINMAAHKQPTCIYDVSHSLESTVNGWLSSTRLPDRCNKRGRVSWEKPQR